MDGGRVSSPVKSGLPRLSKLPTPQPLLHQASATPQATPAAKTNNKQLPKLTSPTKALPSKPLVPSGRRVSGIPPPVGHTPRPSSQQAHRLTSPTKTLASKPPASRSTGANNGVIRNGRPRPKSVQIGPSYGGHVEDTNDRLAALEPISARQQAYPGQSSPSPKSSPFTATNAISHVRKVSRPSLSDRTIESLARLPGTPASDRRKSGIFGGESPNATSPVQSAGRPASAMSAPRRGTVRPSSPVKSTLPGTGPSKREEVNTSRSTATGRSVSASLPRPGQKPPPRSAFGLPSIRTKTANVPLDSRQGNAVRSPERVHPASARSGAAKSLSRTTSSGGGSAGMISPGTSEDGGALEQLGETGRVEAPASRFRAAIELAKATHRITRAHVENNHGYDLETDPFNQRARVDGHQLISKRLYSAHREGRLNMSGLELTTFPEEVLQMYSPSAMANAGVTWHETVDLVIVNGADNAISAFPDELFPEVDPEDAVHDDNLKASVFAGVERMDFRGNQLLSILPGMRFLRRLTYLNLSRNQLGNSSFDIITQIPCLKELHLAGNNLSGFLPQDLKRLSNLEYLDVSDNKILNVPDSIHELTKLRHLDVSNNQLTGVPMDALEALPLVDLDVSSNALVGALFPFSVSGLKTLEQLNVANNSLASLAFHDTIALPNIRILKLSNNRMVSLPDMSGWSELVTIAAGGNKFSQLPQGFVLLRKVRHADFSSNDLCRIDERVALMDSLQSLVLSANPLVDKRFLNMSADSIKKALRPRLDPVSTRSVRSSDSFMDEAIDVRSPEEEQTPFKLSPTGSLDLTAQGLNDDDADGLRSLLGMHDVRSLILSRNKLTTIPYELSLAQNMVRLDLSMCELGGRYLQESLKLPMLQELHMSGNYLGSLQPLIDHLEAPYLRTIDVSNNHLTGALPMLKEVFPRLTEVHAADNKIDSISSKSLKGLSGVVLARNSLRALPAEIGLLWFDGLRQLDVSSNYFRVPNHEILSKGTEAVLAWLRMKIPGYEGDDETF